jgi:hypothetical protein
MSVGSLFRLLRLVRLVQRTERCPKCGTVVDLPATRGVCPRCRFAVAAAKERTWRSRRWALTAISGMCVPLYFAPLALHASTPVQVFSTLAVALFSLCGFGALVCASAARKYQQMARKP